MNVEDVCSIPKCGRPRHARIYCNKHYRRFLNGGIEGIADVQNRACKCCGKTFKFDLRKESNSHFCSKECKLLLYKSTLKTCKVAGCSNQATTNRSQLCGKHRTRMYKHGNTTTVLTLAKYSEGTICKVDGCGKTKILAKYMCNKHYTMWRVHGDPKGGRFEYKIRKAVTHSDGTRTCSECEQRLPITEFHKDKSATDGYRSKCKTCRLGKVKEWYLKDVDKRRIVAKNRRKRNPEKARKDDLERYERDREKRIGLATEHSHRRKARKLKTVVEKGISKKALKKKFGTKCYYCQKEMDFSVGKGRKFNRNMATIEHLIPLSRGGQHTWENIVLACRHCNISKNAKSIQEFEEYNKV